MVNCRVCTQKVIVTLALRVPHMHSLCSLKAHWKRVVSFRVEESSMQEN